MTTHHASHGTHSSYLIGFILSVLLTGAAFFFAPQLGALAVPLILLLALLQLGVQLLFFLHLGTGEGHSSRTMLLVFAAVIILILMGGTLWIMQNLSRLHLHSATQRDLYEGGVVAPQNELK